MDLYMQLLELWPLSFAAMGLMIWGHIFIPKIIKSHRDHRLNLASVNYEAQKVARDTARLNLQAEETHLKRVRLEQQDPR